jgi:hypothetical protein
MAVTVEITRAEGTPVTLALAKQHLNLEADFVEQDDLIQVYVDAAGNAAENYVGHALFEDRAYFRCDFADFEFEAWADAAPVSVEYIPSGAEDYTALPAENYAFRKIGASTCAIAFKGTLPEVLVDSETAVKVTISTTCPAAVKNGILLMVGDAFERREDRNLVGNNSAALNLMRPYKKHF